MPLRFNCPECQAAITVNEGLAGLHTRCPACGANVAVPNPGYAPEATWQPADPGLARPSDFPRQSDYGEDWEHPDSYRTPCAGASWNGTRSGLSAEFIGSIITLVAFVGYMSLGCGSVVLFRGRVDRGIETLIPVLAVVLLIGSLAGLVLMLVARCMCCTSPPQGGLRGLAITSASCYGAGLLLGGLVFLVGIATGFRRDSELIGAMLAILGGLVLLAGHILWCIFLRGVAAAFGENSLAVQLIVFLIVSIVLPLVAVGLLMLLAITLAFGRGGPFLMDIIAFTLMAVVGLTILGWYLALVSRLRGVVSRGGRRSEGYWER